MNLCVHQLLFQHIFAKERRKGGAHIHARRPYRVVSHFFFPGVFPRVLAFSSSGEDLKDTS